MDTDMGEFQYSKARSSFRCRPEENTASRLGMFEINEFAQLLKYWVVLI